MRTSRLYAAGPLAGMMTAALFCTMQGLVGGDGDIELDPRKLPRQIDVVQDIEPPEIVKKEWKVEKPEIIEEPDPEPIPTPTGGDPKLLKLGPVSPPSRPAPSPQIPNFGQADGEYLPLVVVQPSYPPRAEERGIEGYVVVELTVGTDGSVPPDSIRIITAEPKGYFERAARKAAAKFKYKPKIIDGVARPVHGVRYQFTFGLGPA